MANVCVITGGGSGMGFEAAKFMPKDKIIVLSGRTVKKLEGAVEFLTGLGYTAYAKACDTSNRESVRELAEFAASLGEVKNVINSAGVSPAMKGTPEGILRINALGTVYVNQEFSKVMNPGSVIVDVSSNSAYILPSFIIPKKVLSACGNGRSDLPCEAREKIEDGERRISAEGFCIFVVEELRGMVREEMRV